MEYNRPIVLSIAGFDPCGGAGTAADLKTFEQFCCLGMGAVTAQTVQTESGCLSVNWNSFDQLQAQLLPLFESYSINWVKIGIVPDSEFLKRLFDLLLSLNPVVHIIWDPVMAASNGTHFWSEQTTARFQPEWLCACYLITPNAIEARLLTGLDDDTEAVRKLASYCSVLLTGGHHPDAPGTDLLLLEGETHVLRSEGHFYEKHGSGCILSAAITAASALGALLPEACRQAKNYLQERAAVNPQKLTFHQLNE